MTAPSPASRRRLAPIPARPRRMPLEARFELRLLLAERRAALDRLIADDDLARVRGQLALDLEGAA